MKRFTDLLLITIAVLTMFSTVYAADAGKKDIPLYNRNPGMKIGDTCINPMEGAIMVWVPAGRFLMGTSKKQIVVRVKAHPGEKREWFISEVPQHNVYLDGFWIYKNLVTVSQYRKFCMATKRQMPQEPHWKWQDNNPIVNVTWNDASTYAKWARVVLPTEAEWEKSARGTDGRVYPWGNDWDAAKCANWNNSNGKNGHVNGTHPVGSFPVGASPYGCLDMAGNVWEWCADWYDVEYYKNSPARNPTGPAIGKERVMRGGSWDGDGERHDRCSFRIKVTPGGWNYCGGFRCVVRPPGPKSHS